MASTTNRGTETVDIDASMTAGPGHELDEFTGDWIDAIWEAGNADPFLGSHITIERTTQGFKVTGLTYSKPEFANFVGRFRSTNTMVGPKTNWLVYVYEGTERGSRPKNHTGVGFYQFHQSGDLRTFTGGFTAWEEDRNRHVEGRQLSMTEASEIKDAARRTNLFKKFFSEKQERAGTEAVPPLDGVFSKSVIDKLSKHNLDQEINELKPVWGKSPLCMAFLLRTILEKVLANAFINSGLGNRIIDSQRRVFGLKRLIDLAMREQVSGIPILSQRTGSDALSIKFLGDTAAHNLYADVNLDSLNNSAVPQIKTAISELSRLL